MERMKEIDISDIYDDPKSFGAPTFEEYCKNPERWQGTEEDVFSSIDNGPTMGALRNRVEKYVYEVEGYRCKTLTEAYNLLRDKGIPFRELDYRVQIMPETSWKGKFVVKIAPKAEFQKRKAWR